VAYFLGHPVHRPTNVDADVEFDSLNRKVTVNECSANFVFYCENRIRVLKRQ